MVLQLNSLLTSVMIILSLLLLQVDSMLLRCTRLGIRRRFFPVLGLLKLTLFIILHVASSIKINLSIIVRYLSQGWLEACTLPLHNKSFDDLVSRVETL